MGTTAEKLTYLNTTKGKIKDSINLTGAGITSSDTFRSYASKLKQGLINALNDNGETIISNFPKVSGKGSNLSLTPTYEAPMGISVYGDTYQNGTPTPSSPVNIQNVTGLQNVEVCGKNLFNFTGETHGSNVTPTITDNELKVEWTGGFNVYLTDIVNLDSTKTYTISFMHKGDGLIIKNSPISTSTVLYQTGTHSDYTECSFNISGVNQFGMLINRQEASGGTAYIKDIQLEQGSTATTYELYVGTTYGINLGKNLLQNTANSTSSNGIIYAIDDKGGILANGTATATSFIVVQTQQQSPVYEPGTYTVSLLNEMPTKGNVRFEFYKEDMSTRISQNDTTSSMTITLTEKAYLRVSYMFYSSGAPSKFYNIIQVEKGNVATPVQPYFTPIELNKIGDYEDSIKKSTGKNLFDKSTITTGQYIDASGNLVNDNSNFVGDYISIDNTKSYYASQNAGGVIRVGYYDSNKTFISRQLISANYSSLTIPNNAVYVRLSCYNQSLDTLQLELGTQQTSYEPYGKVWYITKNIGKVVLDGTEDWTLNNNYTNNSRFTNNDDILNKTEKNVYCNYFVKGTAGQDNTNIDINGSTGKIMITIPNSIATTAIALQTWLTSNNVSVVYILNTPTYTVITNEELIKELESIKSKNGTTNISVSSEYLPAILGCSALKVEE